MQFAGDGDCPLQRLVAQKRAAQKADAQASCTRTFAVNNRSDAALFALHLQQAWRCICLGTAWVSSTLKVDRQSSSAYLQAPNKPARDAAAGKTAKQQRPDKGKVMDESDSEAAGSDGYEPPAAGAKQSVRDSPSSPSESQSDDDMESEHSSESAGSHASDEAMSGDDQAWSGDKKGRKGKRTTKAVSSKPLRQSGRPSRARTKNLRDASDSDGGSEDSDAMTEAHSSEDDVNQGSDADDSDHDAPNVRRRCGKELECVQ